jgi:hypothetical protein
MSEGYANALILAREGFRVFPSSRIFGPGCEQAATTDPAMLEMMHKIDRAAVWMVRCDSGSGILALDTKRARDFEHLVADFGSLPPTMIVMRGPDRVVRWFRADPNVNIKLGAELQGTRAKFRPCAVIPGSVDNKSGEVYEILHGGALDLARMARLPDAWLRALPRQGESITANIVKRHEFSPQPRWDDY